MKRILILCMVLFTNYVIAQKYYTKTGLTTFKASVEAFEPVEAENESTTAILNVESGDFASLLFIKAFHFKIALMQEHFNENYMDSDEFPKATFRGQIEDFSVDKLTDSNQDYNLNGTLTIKGISKKIRVITQIKKEDNKIVMFSEFNVSSQDFDISIPSIVRKKIAESITIKLCYELVEKK